MLTADRCFTPALISIQKYARLSRLDGISQQARYSIPSTLNLDICRCDVTPARLLHNETTPKTPTHPNPCISRLEAWSAGPGKNLTVEYLALRLTEIGLPKLSKKVSAVVMKETSEELHRFFLDDPFKDMIPAKSAMVDESDDDKQSEDPILDEEKKTKEDEDDQLFATVVVLATIGVSLFATISVCLLCPQAGQFVCQNACPQLCASLYDVIVDGCQRAWFGTKNNINRYMLVTPKGAGNGAALAI